LIVNQLKNVSLSKQYAVYSMQCAAGERCHRLCFDDDDEVFTLLWNAISSHTHTALSNEAVMSAWVKGQRTVSAAAEEP